ncbi:MAG: CHASE2 domain-containing protein [Leptolyngbyaceae cyanobacterium bins.302]|nr:CHASE2 domain-containing protein [Leptolyngbyaceae cyanobacterium bins.302]
MSSFRLKVWHIEQTCVFELSWGKGRQLTAKLPFPNTLKTHYQRWQSAYMEFYKSQEFQESTLRARVDMSGTMATPAIDWRARLVQTEAELTSEFHHWLSSADLFKIRKEIASSRQQAIIEENHSAASPIDVFLTCDSLELERLPWETWEIGTDFAAPNTIRLVRTPANIEAETEPSRRKGKMRILAVLGDDTGLNFQTERDALTNLNSLADITFIGWQKGKATEHLLEDIQQAIANPNGWDILFFAGHSNETNLTGGELTISPNQSILVSEIAPQLLLAKQHGLQFAIFNSCQGLSIANSLISLGLGQVAVMREPIHNRVAQEFLVRFLRQMATYQDVQDALRSTCQSFKLDKNLTYPSAYLIPSLFRHPDSISFRLKPFGWKEKLKQWMPTKVEAIALSMLVAVSLAPPVQRWLLEQRVFMQAVYRQWTGQINTASTPPILLVQIDDRSLQKARIADPVPMRRDYLAKLVNQLSALDARVIGIDFWLDRPHAEDPQLRKALTSAIQRQQSWFVFVVHESERREWLMVTPDVAQPTWSLQGDGTIPLWHLRLLPWQDSTPQPFGYLLATTYRLQTEAFKANPDLQLPSPNLDNQQDLLSQVRAVTAKAMPMNQQPLTTDEMRLQPVTAFSYLLQQRWLQPMLDFSIPPERVYRSISAWQLLEQPEFVLRSLGSTSFESQLVVIMAGGYSEAGGGYRGEDNFPLHPAIAYWRSQQTPPSDNPNLPGGEVHAYMTHHYLNHRFVIPIPDVWVVLAVIPIGKGLALLLATHQSQRWSLILVGTTVAYGLISLQLYLTPGVLLPWLLPSTTVWTYALLTFMRRNHVQR